MAMEVFETQKYFWTTYRKSDESYINAVNKWLTDNCEYDYTSENNGAEHCAIGPIRYKMAVCSGFAEFFDEMLTYAGIPSMTITGTGNGGAHGWNMVYFNDKYYYFDCTENVCLKTEDAFVWRSLAEVPHVAYDYMKEYLK